MHLLWRQSYYGELLSILLSIFFLSKLLLRKRFNSFYKYAVLFYISSILLFSSTVFFFIFTPTIVVAIKYVEVTNFLFGCIEVIVFLHFFTQTAELNYLSRKLKLVAVITSIILLCFSIYATTYEISIHEGLIRIRQLMKIEEIIDVAKRFVLLIPCLIYFYKVYRRNENLRLYEAFISYSLFAYCIFGILSYSLSVNLRDELFFKHIINTFPSVALNLLLFCMFYYTNSLQVKSS